MTAPSASQLPPWAVQQRDQQNGDTSKLYWQQEDQKRTQEEAAIPSTVASPSVDSLDKNHWNQQLAKTDQYSATLTQGTMQSVATQKAEAEQARQKKLEEERAKAIEAMRTQIADFQEQQQNEYETKWNQMQAQIDQYGNQVSSAKLIIQPGQYTPGYSIDGTGGGTPVGKYANAKYQQIATWAKAAGWAEKDIPMVIAISMAESGGNPTATNSSNSNGSIDRGLIQINSVHKALLASGDVKNPVDNLRMAKAIYEGYDGGKKGWSPWVTYQNGAYKKFLSQPASYLQPAKMAPYNSTSPTGQKRTAIVQAAQRVIGLPYVWGGDSLTSGVDCSGLIQQIYGNFGIKMPRRADDQAHVAIGTRTAVSNLQPGDLVAWTHGYRGPNYVGHIAIYAGNNEVIEAPYTGANVRRRTLGTKEKDNKYAFGVALSFQ